MLQQYHHLVLYHIHHHHRRRELHVETIRCESVVADVVPEAVKRLYHRLGRRCRCRKHRHQSHYHDKVIQIFDDLVMSVVKLEMTSIVDHQQQDEHHHSPPPPLPRRYYYYNRRDLHHSSDLNQLLFLIDVDMAWLVVK